MNKCLSKQKMKEIIKSYQLVQGKRKDGSPWFGIQLQFDIVTGRPYSTIVFLEDKDIYNGIFGVSEDDFMPYERKRK